MRAQLRLRAAGGRERTDGGELAALPVEVVALEDGAEQVRLQAFEDWGGYYYQPLPGMAASAPPPIVVKEVPPPAPAPAAIAPLPVPAPLRPEVDVPAAPGPGPLPDPVMIFVMGGGSGRRNASGRLEHGGRWRAEADWPLPRTRTELAYLQADGGLAAAPPADPETRTITADPHHPVPTVGGAITSAEPIMFGGAYDQREGEAMLASTHPGRALADHPGVAVFRGPVLDEDTELTGNVVARLHISIDTPDADIAIKLIDEYPPSADYPEGFAMNLAHGILRLRFRDGFEHFFCLCVDLISSSQRRDPPQPGQRHAGAIRPH